MGRESVPCGDLPTLNTRHSGLLTPESIPCVSVMDWGFAIPSWDEVVSYPLMGSHLYLLCVCFLSILIHIQDLLRRTLLDSMIQDVVVVGLGAGVIPKSPLWFFGYPNVSFSERVGVMVLSYPVDMVCHTNILPIHNGITMVILPLTDRTPCLFYFCLEGHDTTALLTYLTFEEVRACRAYLQPLLSVKCSITWIHSSIPI